MPWIVLLLLAQNANAPMWDRLATKASARGCETPGLDGGWTERFASLHSLPGPETLITWKLQLEKTRATIRVEDQQRTRKGEWACMDAFTLEAISVKKDVIDFGDWSLRCSRVLVNVAEADAVRVRLPQKQEGCDAHRWSTTRSPSPALRCVMRPDDTVLLLGPAPGFERVQLENECDESDLDALRKLPRDGSLRPERKASKSK